ncbi:D-alanine--poly(phosphoribitol) ligase subunit DltA [Staphylococcus aureus]
MKDIIHSLKENAKKYPDYRAIQHNDEVLTYFELNHYSNVLARMIKNESKPLVLYGHMSPFMIVGMFASMKVGCGYVPIDTSIPHDRLQTIIDKIDGQYMFNTTEEELEAFNIQLIDVDMITNVQDTEPFDSKITNSDIAYTIFTSGSTGEPKGVQINYESLNEFTQWIIHLNKLGRQQQWLNQAPFSFDLSVMAIYPCLTTGGTLNLVDKEMIKKPKLLNDMLTQSEINVWVSTPSFMEMCLMIPDLSEADYTSLKEFFFCGEIFTHSTAKALLQKFPSAFIYNTYGPIETTVAVTSILITDEVVAQYNPLPIGKPRMGTSLSLTDEGELIISGKCVSEGYVKDDKRSSSVFKIANNQKSYYTGDKAELRNNLWFIHGRMDFQIKLNGYRMELEEIEFQLRQVSYVKEAIVVPIYKENKVIYLHAVVSIQNNNQAIDAQAVSRDIKSELKQNIPEYMIPRKIILKTNLPLTINGKLDRKKIAKEILL